MKRFRLFGSLLPIARWPGLRLFGGRPIAKNSAGTMSLSGGAGSTHEVGTHHQPNQVRTDRRQP